jgi:DNA-binding GntR family transcriptional regulator
MTDPAPPSVLPTIALLRSHSLAGVVQHEIERMILSGELAAGTRLNENALAAKLSVSRGPIREACRALAELGFVYLVPNRGVFVKRLDRTDAMEVYDLRAGLTALAGSLLAPIVTEADIARLNALLDEMDGAAGRADFPAFYKFNLDFHDVIVEATGNKRLMKLYRALVKEFHLFRPHGLVQQDALVASNIEHRAIVAALNKGDSRGCYEVSFQHVANGKERLLSALDSLTADNLTTDSAGAPKREASFNNFQGWQERGWRGS